MQKAFVTGANGMLADALCPLLKENGFSVYSTDVDGEGMVRLDIRELEKVREAVVGQRPDIVFHLAAETNVDGCELKPEPAYEINAKGTENVAVVCKELELPLVYISTGAVFDGERAGYWIEEDEPNPISVYGKSKLDGEEAVRSLLEKYYIIRAGWMVGGYEKDKKFVHKIIDLMETKKEIPVVIDKTGTLSFTKDIAKGILDIVLNGKYGLYHCVNKGICTRFDVAKKIAEFLNKEDVFIKPVTSEAFPLPAPRGKSEAMLNYNLERMGMDNMRHWEDALREYIKNVKLSI